MDVAVTSPFDNFFSGIGFVLPEPSRKVYPIVSASHSIAHRLVPVPNQFQNRPPVVIPAETA
jgi:hypothetical protein